MADGPDIAMLAALIGDPVRANMLLALLRIPVMTASELADEGGVTSATASSHLRKLLDANLLSVRPNGRHRYFRLADDDVAHHIEQMLCFAQHLGHVRTRPGPSEPAMRRARICYDHLAGAIAVELFARLVSRQCLRWDGHELTLTELGHASFRDLGATLPPPGGRRRECRECLDWSERRPHLAGGAGAALLARLAELDWVRRDETSRAMQVTERGEAGLPRLFR